MHFQKRYVRIVALLLLVGLLSGLYSACGWGRTNTYREMMPLVIGCTDLSGNFSMFSEVGESRNQTVIGLTGVPLLTVDRAGDVVYHAIAGETRSFHGVEYTYTGIADLAIDYNSVRNVTAYTWTLRDDVRFSDGELLTADDVIFTYYVLLDASYPGDNRLDSAGILGVQSYQTQTTEALYRTYRMLGEEIYASGKGSNGGKWTAQQQTWFWDAVETAWKEDLQEAVERAVEVYGEEAAELLDVANLEDENLHVAAAMLLWGFAGYDGEKLITSEQRKTFSLRDGQFPVLEDYYQECLSAYDGDPEAFWKAAGINSTSVLETALSRFAVYWAGKDPSSPQEEIRSIQGIEKLSENSVRVTVQGWDPATVYHIGLENIAPLHYYGQEDLFCQEEGTYGFPRGDTSLVLEKASEPLGAGPYLLSGNEEETVYLTANPYYWKGEAETKYVQLTEVDAEQVPEQIAQGILDCAVVPLNQSILEKIERENGNGQLSGPVMDYQGIDVLGYGYIGINASRVKVGEDADSLESRALRKGLATILSVYREEAVNAYYGAAAHTIQYPASEASWISPEATGSEVVEAYAIDPKGNELYGEDMTEEQREAAALDAAIAYLKEAGYLFDSDAGVFIAAPDGASMEYEILVPGEGKGDHPGMELCQNAAQALQSIGLTLKVVDLTDTGELWQLLDENRQELWCAAWETTVDPSPEQYYASTNIPGNSGGTGKNHYQIKDEQLDTLLKQARVCTDTRQRYDLYQSAMKIVLDWAVEIPFYQRQNGFLFSSERLETACKQRNYTEFYTWVQEVTQWETVVNKK